MDIKAALESQHSKASTMAIVAFIGDDKSRFKILLDLFLKGDYRVTQRAAWPLSYVVTDHPKLAAPHFGKLIHKLNETGNHPAITRNILRMFQEIDLPEKYHGELIDICFRFITGEAYPAAIRAFAITTAANICRHYPDLKKELLLLLDDLSQFPQQPAIRSRVKSALKILKQGNPTH